MTIEHRHGKCILQKLQGYWYVMSIIVDEEYRNKGEGSILLKSALEKCGRPVLLYATSELGSNLEGLKKFYRRFGFIDVKQPNLDTFPYKYNMIKEQ